MARGYRILGVALAVGAAALAALALGLSHDAACRPAQALPDGTQRMKAIVYRCYGSPDVLSYEDVEQPAVADDGVLIKVHAASVNPLDWHYMRGAPYIMRAQTGLGAPTDIRLGVDFAGTVAAVGKSVTRFKPGDAVYGGADGAFAGYVSVREGKALAPKPANLTFEQAAAAPIAGSTALQALRDLGALRPGQKVLINGASGGVGTFAVQIARSYGAEVTGVCSTRNVAMVRSIGADHVIDYTLEDFTQGGQRYDLILDNVGNHSLPALRRALVPGGTVVIVGGPNDGRWLAPLDRVLGATVYSKLVSQKFVFILAQLNREDLAVLGDLMQSGELTPVIDRRYPLSEVPAAIRYLEEGHSRGKVVIDVAETSGAT